MLHTVGLFVHDFGAILEYEFVIIFRDLWNLVCMRTLRQGCVDEKHHFDSPVG
jgi:hypothetical protein